MDAPVPEAAGFGTALEAGTLAANEARIAAERTSCAAGTAAARTVAATAAPPLPVKIGQ